MGFEDDFSFTSLTLFTSSFTRTTIFLFLTPPNQEIKNQTSKSFLTDPTFLGDMGLDVKKRDASALFDPDGESKRDSLLVIAYPSFNVNEMIAVDDAWRAMKKRREGNQNPVPPVIVFNGELERIYSGYYPPVFYRRLAKVASKKDGGILASEGSEATYYIKNFKGLNPGILYRCW